jgi:threonine dehydrogenase-like Zn-dependent dehydrogenase
MKAAVFHEPFDIRIEEIKTPEPKEGEVLIKIKSASVCGTDLHIYQGKVDIKTPLVLGHDGSGVIEKIGKGVSNFKGGERVIPSIVFSCQKCKFCRMGKRNLCEKANYIGFETNGSFAEYLLAPANCIFKIPRNVSFDEAAMVEPIELALHTIELLKPKKQEVTAIIGQGPIGLTATQVAKISGLRVIAIDKNKEKLVLSKKLGADFVIDASKEDIENKVLKLTNNGVDYTIEAVGSQPTIDISTKITKPLGKIAILGEGKDLHGPLLEHTKEQTVLTPVSGSGWGYQKALRLLSQNKINVKIFISRTVKLEELPKIFQQITKNRTKPTKILIRVS